MRHLLVTNDYPPKMGGIQNYLWELWRRQPAEETVVLTRPHPGDETFDERQNHWIVRTEQRLILPEPWLRSEIRSMVEAVGIDLVLFDPAVPAGLLGPRLGLPYGLILHGAEVTIPGRIPGSRQLLGDTLRKSELVITAGAYSTQEAERAAGQELPVVVVPPGVDTDRFRPLTDQQHHKTRAAYGLRPDQPVIVSVSRLVPRKGMDVTIQAAGLLKEQHPDLVLLIAGRGRDRRRLERLAASCGAPVRFLDAVPDEDLPALYGMADIFAMLCRVRWGGLEQEGFGIVFLEAAAAGVPQVAGKSGGAAEAVIHEQTGLVVEDPGDPHAVAAAFARLLDDPIRARAMGRLARTRAEEEFSYDLLAVRMRDALREVVDRLGVIDVAGPS